jgi:Protein of unknown function (DUF5661)/Protein of unknown function (DUF664)
MTLAADAGGQCGLVLSVVAGMRRCSWVRWVRAPGAALRAGGLDFHRDTLLDKCVGLTAGQPKQRAVPPPRLSLLGLVRHMTEVERWWFRVHAANTDMPFPYAGPASGAAGTFTIKGMPSRSRFTLEEARAAGERIGVDWGSAPFDLEQFRMGMDVELEHGTRDPQTNVTDDDLIMTAKIARAHLNEFPDYYTRLAKMEAEAEAEANGTTQGE